MVELTRNHRESLAVDHKNRQAVKRLDWPIPVRYRNFMQKYGLAPPRTGHIILAWTVTAIKFFLRWVDVPGVEMK